MTSKIETGVEVKYKNKMTEESKWNEMDTKIACHRFT